MKKTFEIGDLQLHNQTVRESIMFLEQAMANREMVSIQEVTIEGLARIEGNEKAKDGLRAISQTVMADAEILQAVNQNDVQRQYEIREHLFFFELMKRLERNAKKVYVLGITRTDVEEYVGYFLEKYPKLQIEGAGCLEECVGTDDALVNEINSNAVDAIISLLPSPQQEIFYLEHRGKISTGLWYGMGEIDPRKTKRTLMQRVRKHRLKKDLEKHIHE